MFPSFTHFPLQSSGQRVHRGPLGAGSTAASAWLGRGPSYSCPSFGIIWRLVRKRQRQAVSDSQCASKSTRSGTSTQAAGDCLFNTVPRSSLAGSLSLWQADGRQFPAHIGSALLPRCRRYTRQLSRTLPYRHAIDVGACAHESPSLHYGQLCAKCLRALCLQPVKTHTSLWPLCPSGISSPRDIASLRSSL